MIEKRKIVVVRKAKRHSRQRPVPGLAVLSALSVMIFLPMAIQVYFDEDFSSVSRSVSELETPSDWERQGRPIHHRPVPARPDDSHIHRDLVKKGDFIYYKAEDRWDAAPIVVESHKLIFFTIPKAGCTVWKQLFRRMMGHSDWLSQDGEKLLPHNPQTNGLRYLYHYNLSQASEMMTSPEWTRALMVRDPKLRVLSAFLDKSVSNDHRHIIQKCCPDKSCVDEAQNLQGFLALASLCDDAHWRPQNLRLDFKYWPYLDFVGHVETAAADAKALLERIGAWEEYGASGWGKDGKSAIFESKGKSGAGVHATWAGRKIWTWYTPQIEREVERLYRGDYENPLFNFEQYKCLTCGTQVASIQTDMV